MGDGRNETWRAGGLARWSARRLRRVVGLCRVVLHDIADDIGLGRSERRAALRTVALPPRPRHVPAPRRRARISPAEMVWVERELARLNQTMVGATLPARRPDFLQPIPRRLLEGDGAPTIDAIAESVLAIFKQTATRIGHWRLGAAVLEVEISDQLPSQEPAHIEYGGFSTVIRIRPEVLDDAFALATVLAHEIAHFVRIGNAACVPDALEEEKRTDLTAFRCGLGTMYLQGITDTEYDDRGATTSTFGYLSLEAMAYAHVRCASQHGVPASTMTRALRGRARDHVEDAIAYLERARSAAGEPVLSEVVLCPREHPLRVLPVTRVRRLRCPKCSAAWDVRPAS